MAQFARLKVLNTMVGTGMVRSSTARISRLAKKVAAGSSPAAVRCWSSPNRGDHAWEVFTELERYCRKELPGMILGVGSIVDPGRPSLHQLRR